MPAPDRRVAASICLLVLASLVACGGPSGEVREARTRAVAADAEWAWLQQAHQELTAHRGALEQARMQAKAKADAEARTSGKEPADPATAPAVQDLARDVALRTDELRRRLLAFINDNPPPAGTRPTGHTLDAIRMKSGEDILVAQEHMNEGGDYRMAIDIYEAALAVDPENPRLRQELQAAQARRYMTRERFARAQEGMAPGQIRALLGPPNVNDVREYPDRGVTAWFYARDPKGAAAAVWFENKGHGPVVYRLDFDALPAP